MKSEPQRNGPIRFGVFEADLAGRVLRKAGVRIRLQEQPFRLLAMLLARPGEVVTREELQRELWPNEQFGEFDLGLNTAVKKVRQALNDSADNPKWIETVPRVGYKFLGTAGDPRPADVSSDVGVNKDPRRRLQLWSAAACLILLCAAGWLWFSGKSEPALDPRVMIELPLTTYPGEEIGPSFSPGCGQVAYSSQQAADSAPQIYFESVGSGRPTQLTSGEASAQAPAWSPDGRSIAFVRLTHDSTRREIYAIPALGGAERKLVEVNNPYLNANELAWSPDGAYLAFGAARTDTADVKSIALIPTQGGKPRWLTSPEPGLVGDGMPAFSPDGSQLAFVRAEGFSSGWNIHVLPLTGEYEPAGDPVQLTGFSRTALLPVWMPGGRSLLFLGEQGSGRQGIWQITASGGEPELVWRIGDLEDGFGATSLAVCQDPGGRLLVAYSYRQRMDTDIYRVDLEGPQRGRAVPIVQTTSRDTNARHSPDGKSIAYLSGRPYRDIWVADADGSNPRQLTELESLVAGPLSWSLDSRKVAGHFRGKGAAEVYWVDVETRRLKRLTEHEADDVLAVWSRDGRWIYFLSNRTGSYTIWRMSSDGGQPEEFLPVRSPAFKESADGRFLYFTPLQDGGLFRAPVNPALSPGERLAAAETLLAAADAPNIDYRLGRSGIYFFHRKRGASFRTANVLRWLDPNTSETADLVKFDGYLSSIAPDESHILTVFGRRPGVDIRLLEPKR